MPDVKVPDDGVIVLFGANGDLSRRMVLPAFYHLFREGWLAKRWRLIGSSQSQLSDEEFRDFARESVTEFGRGDFDEAAFREFAQHLRFVPGAFQPGDSDAVGEAVTRAEKELGGTSRRLFYLAVPPGAFVPITRGIGETGLGKGATVVYEKPFGTNLEGFRELNKAVHEVLDEQQVFRIDHFLGKEAVQNILVFRFANGMFEPIWNRANVVNVQIDVPETIGIGTRAAFYEKTGALRDMIVTHLFQVLSFVAMEPPVSFSAKHLLDEKIKVFEAMKPLGREDIVRGQYEGYRDEEGVASDSDTETFVAARVFVDNWRWGGVPFYLRTGKCMAEDRWAVTLAFRKPPSNMFKEVEASMFERNYLCFQVDPKEHINVHFLAKVPGPTLEVDAATMEFRAEEAFPSELIDAYERLIHDALLGDRTLFTRGDGIREAWEDVEDVIADPPEVHTYARGSWGPPAADELIAPDRWYMSS
ncbi:glucose-6-phosphate dehydrogenase [soil metagenome]